MENTLFPEHVKKMSNAQLLNAVDDFFGFDGYYADLRKLITKELESRLNVAVDKFGHRFDINGAGNEQEGYNLQ